MTKEVTTLDDVKVGDVFARHQRGWYYQRYECVKVQKITDKQVVIGGDKYRKDNGRPIGHNQFLLILTDDVKNSMEHDKLLAYCRNIRFDKLTLVQLRDIAKIVRVEDV